jgi:hypothetical protein
MARQGKKVKFTQKNSRQIAAMRKPEAEPTYIFDGKIFYTRKKT